MLLKLNFARKPARLLLLVFLLFSYDGEAQSFTITAKNLKLEKVFLQIEQQSDYNFIYTEELLAQSVPVSFVARNISLDSVLRLCFQDQPLTYIIEQKHIVVRKKVVEFKAPVVRELSGKVVNEQGEAAPGISITLKPGNLVTVSNQEGMFKFSSVPFNTVLIVSGAEIETQEINPGSGNYAFIMVQPRMSLLDESFVIAYGKSSKRISTGTVSSVKKEKIEKQPVSNILAVMAGRVPGLQVFQVSGAPGSSFNLQLRGINSLANGTDPLIVIDGIPYPSQSLNGVIGGGAGTSSSPLNGLNPADIESVEVLKDADATAIYGSRGANGVILISTVKGKAGKTSVDFSFYTGIGGVSKKMNLLGTKDYLQMRREAFANDGTNPTTANAPDLLLWDSTRQTNWQDVFLGNIAHSTDAKINLSGGSDQTNFLFGLGYHRETTVYPGNFGDNRKTMNLNLSHRSVNKKLLFSFSSNAVFYSNLLPQQDLYSSINLAPNSPVLYTASGELNWENGTWSNPMARTRATFKTKSNNFIAQVTASYELIPGLMLKFSGGYNRLENEDHAITPKSASNPASNPVSSAQFGTKNITTLIGEPYIEYSRKIKNARFTFLLGSTLQRTDQYFIYQRGTGYNSDELLGSLQSAAQVSVLSEGDIRYTYAGVFSRIKYDLAGKYLFSLTLRRDGSSRYGEENRYADFGSLGAGWIFSKEKWLRKSKVLSFGKVKISAGVTGNDQIGDYKYLELYTPYTSSYLGSTVYYPAQLYNPVYGWEKVNKLELATDLGFFSDMVLATFSYYRNNTSNQLVNYPLPVTTGFGSIVQNIPATIRNTGLEMEINGTVMKTKNLTWQMGVNITIPRNKLVSFENLSSSSYASRYVIGQPLSIVKRYEYLGVDPTTGNHQFRDFNQDGQFTTSGDWQKIIFTGQQLYGGFENTLRSGPWELSFLFQFARVPNASNYLTLFSRPGLLMNQPKWVMNRWQKVGDITDVQRFANTSGGSSTAFSNYRLSDAAYSDASYLRCKNLSITYRFSAQKEKRLKGAEIYLRANNLFTISRYKGLDPETLTLLMPPIRLVTAGFKMNLN